VWVVGTAVLAVLLLAAAWLLAIQPVVARASEDTAQAVQQRDQNGLLELEIASLKEQFTHLDEYVAELDALRLQMPVDGDGASISRELQSLADQAGVTIVSVAPSLPQAFVPAEAAPAPVADAAVAEGGSDTASTDGDVTADATAAAPATVALPGFYAVPITLSSVGTYDSSVAFLRAVQSQASRLYLVSSINAVTQETEGANGGRPATNAGDLELTMTGYAFVLADTAAATETTDERTLPVPSSQANPFAPAG
jgi:Tfp pilus assembly protein PilO